MGEKASAQEKREKKEWLETRFPFQSRFLKIREEILVRPVSSSECSAKIWDTVVTAGAVGILPIDAEENLILVEQWRRAIRQITLEIPAGMLELGEPPERCAQRELQEESGYFAHFLEPFGSYFVSPGLMTEQVHLFIATDLIYHPLQAEDSEGIDVKKFSLQEALDKIERQEITDAKTALAILKYARRR